MAIRLESDDFSGWIAVAIRDANGQEHLIVEKVPVLTTLPLSAASSYPIALWLDATTHAGRVDPVAVSLVHGVQTVTGVSDVNLAAADVKWR